MDLLDGFCNVDHWHSLANVKLLCKSPRDVEGLVCVVVHLLSTIRDLDHWTDSIPSEDVDELLDTDCSFFLSSE